MVVPSRVSGRGYKIGPVCLSVCPSVCQLFSALTGEPFDVRTQNLIQGCISTISRPSSKVKVKGQKSRSPHQNTYFLQAIRAFYPYVNALLGNHSLVQEVRLRHDVIWRDVIWLTSYGVTSSGDVM